MLTNITPTSLRNRLTAFRQLSIYLPFLGLSKKDRDKQSMLRSTWVLSRYLSGVSVVQILREAAMSKGRFNDLLVVFSRIAFELTSHPQVSNREMEGWRNLLKGTSNTKLKKLLPTIDTLKRLEDEDEIEFELRT